MKVIQTLGLTKRYGDVLALDDVSLHVEQGEIFGLLGPNGAGKSTLVGILAGLIRPSSGGARILGRAHDDPEARRRLGYLPELFRSAPWLTAAETLRFHAAFLGCPLSDHDLLALLERVGLPHAAQRRVAGFSKGMEQRLAWAAALVGDPELLLLDEPTSALDPGGRHEMSDLMRELRERGVTIFLNSHLLSDLEGLCDSVALIHHGRLGDAGPVARVLEGAVPQFRFSVGPLPAAVRSGLQARGIRVTVNDSGCELLARMDRQDLPALHRELVEHGVAVYEVAALRRTLEDWFLEEVETP
ncbi:MAG: ABC transporter ATP-binding protein [Clostridia bacterium]